MRLLKCFNCILQCNSEIHPHYGAFLLLRRGFIPIQQARKLLSCTKCAGRVARLERERAREDTLNSPLEQLYDLLVIRALSLCPVNLWVDEKVLSNTNWPSSPFRNATISLPKGDYMHWGGFMLITITCTGNLCLQHLYKKNELVLHVTFTAFVVDIQCSMSWTFQLFYIYFLYLVSLLDCSLAPSTLISYPCWCLFSLKPSSNSCPSVNFHRDVLTSLMVPCCSTKIPPPHRRHILPSFLY